MCVILKKVIRKDRYRNSNQAINYRQFCEMFGAEERERKALTRNHVVRPEFTSWVQEVK